MFTIKFHVIPLILLIANIARWSDLEKLVFVNSFPAVWCIEWPCTAVETEEEVWKLLQRFRTVGGIVHAYCSSPLFCVGEEVPPDVSDN